MNELSVTLNWVYGDDFDSMELIITNNLNITLKLNQSHIEIINNIMMLEQHSIILEPNVTITISKRLTEEFFKNPLFLLVLTFENLIYRDSFNIDIYSK